MDPNVFFMLGRQSLGQFLHKMTLKRIGQTLIPAKIRPDITAEPVEVISVRDVHAATPSFKFDCKIYLRIPL